MEYGLYIDIFFLENFMMDYLLLLLVRKVLKSTAAPGNIALGALIGSLLFCIVLVLPLPFPAVKFLLFHIVVNTVMIKCGLKIPWGKELVKALGFLYICAFLLGGIMEHLLQYADWMQVGSLFFALAVGSYYGAGGVLFLLELAIRKRSCYYKADLYWEGNILTVPAIVDTGNSLRDPVSADPVSIIDSFAAQKLFEGRLPEKIRYIPYHSVGKKSGILMAVRLDQICIHEGRNRRKERRWIEQPLVAVSEDELSSDGTYRMLLHPDL